MRKTKRKHNLKSVIAIAITVFFSVGCENFFKEDFGNYKLTITPVTSIVTDFNINNTIAVVDEKTVLLGEYSYKKHQLRLVNVLEDTLVKVVDLPDEIKKVSSISVKDVNSFAFLSDTIFYIYKNGELLKFDHVLFNDNYLPSDHSNIIYNPKEETIITAVVQLKELGENEKVYASNFLNIYHLSDTTSEMINFPYPSQYHDFNLRIPSMILSSSANNLIVSFHLDDNIYKINLLNKRVESVSCKSPFSEIDKVFYSKGVPEHETIDEIQNNVTYKDRYGPAFYDEDLKQYYRLYYPVLPLKNKKGGYYSYGDKGIHMIVLNEQEKTSRTYNLPAGQYNVPRFWSYNKFKNTLIYPKIIKHVKYKNRCYYNIHNLFFYNY